MLLFIGSMFFLLSMNSIILKVRESMLSNSIKESRRFRTLLRKEEENMEMDVCWKEYFRDDARYADVINGIGCGGQQLVHAGDLQEMDTQKWYRGIGKTGKVPIRDMVRKVAFGVNFAIVGIENQEVVDYAMPFRCMLYDVGEYEKQVSKIRRKLRRLKGLSAGEYLYGFAKDSRLYPVVTFVLYGGKEQWDGPKRLHDMLEWTELPEKLKEFVSDYPIHIIKIREFENTDVFQTDVKQVFDFIRCSGNKSELVRLVQKDKRFQSMDEDAYEVVTKYVNAEELIQVKDEYRGKDGKVNMCQALKELIEDGRMEGHAEGKKEIVLRMYADGNIDVEMACKYLECTPEIFMEYAKEAKSGCL